MLEQTRKANEANTPYRQRIIEVKRKLRAQIQDMPRRFAAVTARVEAQIEQIVRERASGKTPVPQIEFGELDRITEAQKDHIRQRGCLVIRNVFDDARVDAWTAGLSKYLEANDYLEKLKKGGAVDNYFSTLASAKPQIYGVFWSRAQMEARTDPAMARAQAFLNGLWRASSPNGPVFDPDQNLIYADRVRFRQPGDASLGLSAHVDAGSIDRWIDPAYHGTVYRHVFGGDLEDYDPFEAWGRTEIQEIPSPAVCSMFRTFQGWTALTRQGPNDGTLQLLPIADAMTVDTAARASGRRAGRRAVWRRCLSRHGDQEGISPALAGRLRLHPAHAARRRHLLASRCTSWRRGCAPRHRLFERHVYRAGTRLREESSVRRNSEGRIRSRSVGTRLCSG